VIVDGQPATVFPGGTATQMDVAAPATLLTTPGSYRLTVVDPARQIGDAFVVASQPMAVGLGRAAVTATPGDPSGERPAAAGTVAVSSAVPTATTRPGGPSPLTVIEDVGPPYRTALGYQALFSNTSGILNTASGYQALYSNTTGGDNTAIGAQALSANTSGSFSTASGFRALHFNTTGSGNTASGYQALFGNTTGGDNTASGYQALLSNTTGIHNTASGVQALYSNTTAWDNTASGFRALYHNTTGANNTASGVQALFRNTGGAYNTASGTNALYSNTTGVSNTANGHGALYSNTTGFGNTTSGDNALYHNTTGHLNTALGLAAGFDSGTGSYNIFLGADVAGEATDSNTIRIGLPYGSFGTGSGQNKTFIAGIHGTQLTGPAVQVFIDANGQLGTLTPPIATGTVTAPVSQLQQQVNAQQQKLRLQEAVNADLRARLARLEALLLSANRK
jgi:hypothetical protein